MSPTAAVTVVGLKVSPPLPTWTWVSAADAEVAARTAARAAEVIVKRILMDIFSLLICLLRGEEVLQGRLKEVLVII